MEWIRVVGKADRKAGRNSDIFLYCKCPVCNERTIEDRPTYCPHCGTKVGIDKKR